MCRIAWSLVCAFVVVSATTSLATAAPRTTSSSFAYAAPAVYSWTGFYIGAHGGYGWSNFTGSDPAGSGSGTENASGFLGGAQIGFNYQINRFVIGVEGDYSFADVNKTINDAFIIPGSKISLKNDFFATLAARFGFAFNNALIFAKAGVAWTRDKWDVSDGLGGTATGTFDRNGYVLGLGVEYAFARHFSAKLEYNYLGFSAIRETLTTTGGLTASPADVSLNSHLLKLGLNYRF